MRLSILACGEGLGDLVKGKEGLVWKRGCCSFGCSFESQIAEIVVHFVVAVVFVLCD